MGRQARIVVCDDEPSIRKTLLEVLGDEGYLSEALASGEALLQYLRQSEQRCDLILLDVWLPGLGGVETLARLRELGHRMPVIIISGHATLDSAVKATRLGAFDFLEKPLNLDRVLLSVNHALRQAQLERKQSYFSAREELTMVGESPAIQALRREIELTAPTPGRVLILGESGVGKEVVARMIHTGSPRREEPFVEMNCAAIPAELIDSELFGHVKGSFTGAVADRSGKFEQADGGTLFLDEIGDMAIATQAKVLRVLQEQRFQRIGGSKTLQVDVRVLAATNKDLAKEIREGRFREDLYFRLNVVPLEVPPLRARPEDIPLLCGHFVRQFAQQYGRPALSFEPSAMDLLKSYGWPGNVRELRNVVERLMIMVRQGVVERRHLPASFRSSESEDGLLSRFGTLREARDDFERRFIEFHLKKHEGNVSRTAEAIGLERSHLHRKIRQYALPGSAEESG